jgi:hypothetical protein
VIPVTANGSSSSGGCFETITCFLRPRLCSCFRLSLRVFPEEREHGSMVVPSCREITRRIASGYKDGLLAFGYTQGLVFSRALCFDRLVRNSKTSVMISPASLPLPTMLRARDERHARPREHLCMFGPYGTEMSYGNAGLLCAAQSCCQPGRGSWCRP